jgi:DNA primase
MSADELLSRLKKVKKNATGWVACCPAHNDKSPSLAVRELDDGRVLVHCFGGCSVEEVLDSVGMTFDDLFPERAENRKGEARPFAAADVLRMISFESVVVAASASTMRQRKLSESEHERLYEAAAKIQGALSACGIEWRK